MFPAMQKPAFPKKDGDKKPFNPREDPLARDSRGKATRDEVRKVARVPAPRKPQRGEARGSAG